MLKDLNHTNVTTMTPQPHLDDPAHKEAQSRLREAAQRSVELGTAAQMQEMMLEDLKDKLVEAKVQARNDGRVAKDKANQRINAAKARLNTALQQAKVSVASAKSAAESAKARSEDSIQNNMEMKIEAIKKLQLGAYDEGEREDEIRAEAKSQLEDVSKRMTEQVKGIEQIANMTTVKLQSQVDDAVTQGQNEITDAEDRGQEMVAKITAAISKAELTLEKDQRDYEDAEAELQSLDSELKGDSMLITNQSDEENPEEDTPDDSEVATSVDEAIASASEIDDSIEGAEGDDTGTLPS